MHGSTEAATKTNGGMDYYYYLICIELTDVYNR